LKKREGKKVQKLLDKAGKEEEKFGREGDVAKLVAYYKLNFPEKPTFKKFKKFSGLPVHINALLSDKNVTDTFR